MSASDNLHHQGSWYPEGHPQQGMMMHSHQQYFQPPGGSRAPPSNHYPPHTHHGMQPHHAGFYGHQQYSYDGADEAQEDSNTLAEQPGSSRDSFLYHHQYQQQQATPLQPPPNVYNGPPVTALVPRFPRAPAVLYAQQGYTPNHHYEQDNNNRRISFPSSLPHASYPSTGGRSDAANKEDRRTSFGYPTISTGSHFMIPTPQCQIGDKQSDESSQDSAPMIPLPPATDQKNNEETSNDNAGRPPLLESNSSPNPLQEYRGINLLSNKFEPEGDKASTTTSIMNTAEPVKKKPPTVQDASLLLGLRTDDSSFTSSPATVPEMKDEAQAVDTATTMKEPTAAATELPKTCFPAPVPKNYPKSLALPNDNVKLNALHCFIRTELLEIFVVEPSNENLKFRHAPCSSVGRVGLRCVHCTTARHNSMNASRDDEAPMAVFYPKSVNEIYRLVTSWQRCHVRKCKSLPPSVRGKWKTLRDTEKSRGKTAYWVESAKEIGLVDCPSRAGGIRFEIPNEDSSNETDQDEDVEMTNTENNEPVKAAASTKENAQTVMTSPLGFKANNKSNGVAIEAV